MVKKFVKWVNSKDLFTSQDSHIAEDPNGIDPWSVIRDVLYFVFLVVVPIVLGVYSQLR